MQIKPTIAVLGGTGALGSGLVKRWAQAGYPVIIGSRSSEKAQESADSHNTAGAALAVRGLQTAEAARQADVIVIAVPFSNHADTLLEIKEAVQGKIVIDAVVPLVPPKVSVAQLPSEGSASIIAQKTLGDDVRVVGAFHNVGAAKLAADGPVECDVLICGDDKDARELVAGLTRDAGLRGVEAGPIANSVAIEAMTSILIGINRKYKVDCAGIRITGLDSSNIL